MIITFPLNGRTMSVMAPLGAAAYTTKVEDASAQVLFAMMRKNEDECAMDTINWLLDQTSSLNWMPVSARPEEQTVSGYTADGFVSYDFILENGAWLPASADLASFLQITSNMKTIPASPPSSLKTTMAAFMRENPSISKKK